MFPQVLTDVLANFANDLVKSRLLIQSLLDKFGLSYNDIIRSAQKIT